MKFLRWFVVCLLFASCAYGQLQMPAKQVSVVSNSWTDLRPASNTVQATFDFIDGFFPTYTYLAGMSNNLILYGDGAYIDATNFAMDFVYKNATNYAMYYAIQATNFAAVRAADATNDLLAFIRATNIQGQAMILQKDWNLGTEGAYAWPTNIDGWNVLTNFTATTPGATELANNWLSNSTFRANISGVWGVTWFGFAYAEVDIYAHALGGYYKIVGSISTNEPPPTGGFSASGTAYFWLDAGSLLRLELSNHSYPPVIGPTCYAQRVTFQYMGK